MKALGKLKAETGIWMMDVPTPVVGDNDVLIKIKKTAICGTDIHIYKWDEWAQKTVPVPMVTGHEFVGEIAAIGRNVAGFSIGDRVSGEGHITCGLCRNCRAGKRFLCRHVVGVGSQRQGCFAEYFVLPAFNAFKIPDDVPDHLASILDPFGNSTHAALSFSLVGEDVLITGAGPVGLMAVAIARHVGARHIVVTDVNDYRLDLARKMGATMAINPAKMALSEVMATLDMHEGFDVGLEMSGHPQAFNQMLESMNNGGNVVLVGLLPAQAGIDWNHVIFKGLQIKGIYGREMFETWYKMVSMLQSGLNIEPIITHQFHVNDFEQGFQTMLSGQSGKVILNWD